MTNENHSTIGYGSIFLPPSLMRVDDSVGSVDHIYEENKSYGDRDIMRKEAVEAWAHEEREGSKEIVPVKVEGLRRNYNYETARGGTMLDVERDEDSWMNPVIVTGLDDEEKNVLDSSEEGYDVEEIRREDLTPYLEEHEELVDQAAEDGVRIYIGDSPPRNRVKNQIYHDRVRTGIDMIGEMYGEELGEQIWEDFKSTTYENPVPGLPREKPESSRKWLEVPEMVEEAWSEEAGRWQNTIKQNERAQEAFNSLVEDDLLEE